MPIKIRPTQSLVVCGVGERLQMNDTLCGDCLSTMKAWADGCADMCVTSPPYWGLRSYSWGGDFSLPHKKHSKDGKPLHDWHDLDEVYQGCSDCPALRPCYGIEPTLDEYLAKTVEIFREVRRVLKDWGTLWLNVGDAMTGGGRGQGQTAETGSLKQGTNKGSYMGKWPTPEGLSDGQPLMLPERIALALQADGWILRSKIIWCKAWSFHDCKGRHITEAGTDLFGDAYEDVILDEPDYVGSCMPESVNGTRWVRHKVKTNQKYAVDTKTWQVENGNNSGEKTNPYRNEWADCPGCKVCEPNGGLVLRQGSWRPTNSWEYMYLFSKSRKYYCDGEAVKEDSIDPESLEGRRVRKHHALAESDPTGYGATRLGFLNGRSNIEGITYPGRNLRSVWCINPQPLKLKHYASFPEALVEPCIKAGTSEKGNCPNCGMPWARVIDRPDNPVRDATYDGKQVSQDPQFGHKRIQMGVKAGRAAGLPHDNTVVPTTTLGWKPTCNCNAGEPVPAVVLDPFMGSSTSALVAERLGRNWIGCEVNPDYVTIGNKRLADARGGLM